MLAKFLKENKLLIAVVSLIGSIAGVAFSVSDVHTELQLRSKGKKKVSSKP